LGIARVERREEVADLGALARRFLELAAQLPATVHGQAAAAVLEEEVEARGGAKAGDGGDVEREDDGLGYAGDLGGDPAHEPANVHLLAVPLPPGIEPDEDGAEVGLVGAGDEPVAADRLVGLDTLGLLQDLL